MVWLQVLSSAEENKNQNLTKMNYKTIDLDQFARKEESK